MIIGNSTPRFCYGLNLNASWHGIGLSLFFQGVGKRDWYPSLDCAYFWGKYNRPYGLFPKIHTIDRWTEENPDPNAFWPRTNSYLTTDTGCLLIKGTADRYLVDASYFAIKNITLGYTLPTRIAKKIAMNRVRLYTSFDNVALFTHLNGMDPQYNLTGSTYYSYTPNKNLTIGLDINF